MDDKTRAISAVDERHYACDLVAMTSLRRLRVVPAMPRCS
jgi:hypothetical protein